VMALEAPRIVKILLGFQWLTKIEGDEIS